MTIYIKALYYLVKRVIANGPHVPTKTVSGENVPKKESEWNDNDLKLIDLFCYLDSNEFNRVLGCDST